MLSGHQMNSAMNEGKIIKLKYFNSREFSFKNNLCFRNFILFQGFEEDLETRQVLTPSRQMSENGSPIPNRDL